MLNFDWRVRIGVLYLIYSESDTFFRYMVMVCRCGEGMTTNESASGEIGPQAKFGVYLPLHIQTLRKA